MLIFRQTHLSGTAKITMPYGDIPAVQLPILRPKVILANEPLPPTGPVLLPFTQAKFRR
jgi:hypothetical protein